jgi:4'-phosphopantetheinyl transferase
VIEHVNELGVGAPRVGTLPTGAAVSVWSLDTTLETVGGHRVSGIPPMLDGNERDRATRLLRAGDRQRYLASHIGLRVLLGAFLGRPPEEVTFHREECPCCGEPHGRPAVTGGGVHFSLSHSDDLAYYAFAAVPVGVDVEAVPAEAAVADVLASLHPDETAELTALADPEDRRLALGRVWARKEAYFKGLGTGLALGLSDPYIGSAPTPAPVPDWTLTDLPTPPGYTAALALHT